MNITLRLSSLATTLLISIGCIDAGIDPTDGESDETEGCQSQIWYSDFDGDGFGDDATEQTSCGAPTAGAMFGGDCDDTDPEVNPDAQEIYDGIDNDCNQLVDDMPHWGYSDEGGAIPPGEWSQWWPSCGGDSQSPIDIILADIVDVPPVSLELGYMDTGLKVENNGHTLEWTIEPGSTLGWEGETYVLQQFHIHAASERTVMGEHWAMEIHMVHLDDGGTPDDKSDDQRVVIAIPVIEGVEDPFLDSIGWSDLPVEEGEEIDDPMTTYNPDGLLPIAWLDDPQILTYAGSLTTPPCTENVQWVVLGQELELSVDQIASFTSIYNGNFRPVQPVNGRELARTQANL